MPESRTQKRALWQPWWRAGSSRQNVAKSGDKSRRLRVSRVRLVKHGAQDHLGSTLNLAGNISPRRRNVNNAILALVICDWRSGGANIPALYEDCLKAEVRGHPLKGRQLSRLPFGAVFEFPSHQR